MPAFEVMENNLRHRRIVSDGVVMGLRHWFRKIDSWTVAASTDDRADYSDALLSHLRRETPCIHYVLIWIIKASSSVKKCKQTCCCISFNDKLTFGGKFSRQLDLLLKTKTKTYTLWGKKTAPFYFCNSFVRTSSFMTMFGTRIHQ